jgi:predicted secreted protein
MPANESGFLGRELQFFWATGELGPLVAVPGVTDKGITRQGATIDVSSDEDGGYRVLLGRIGQREINITLSGFLKSNVLRAAWHGGDSTCFGLFRMVWPNGDQLDGSAVLANFDETGKFDGAETFTAAIQTTGPWTYQQGT